MSEKSAVDIIVEQTISAARKAVSEAQFDTSTYGVITEKVGKRYKVAAFGGEYRITSDHEYSVGQKVVVTALQKNFRNIVVTEGNTSVELLNVKSIVGQLGDDLEKLSDRSDSEQKEAQSQINNTVTTYYRHGDPSGDSNDPSSNWTTDEQKKRHEGDIYQNIDNGKCYRWADTGNGYEWVRIMDSALINVISTATFASNLAQVKKRVFHLTGTSHPTPPYDSGDLWVQGEDGDLFVCITTKDEFKRYSVSDWVKATKYTDDTRAEEINSDLLTLSDTESEHYQELTKSISATNKNVSSNKSDIDSLKEVVDGIQDSTGSFTEQDYELTKAQVATNKSDISTIKTNATNQHNDLMRKISATNTAVSELKTTVANITVDNFLERLGMKINSDGVLCYVVNS